VIRSEVVWNETATDDGATGGGVSTVFALPTWQESSAVPKSPAGGSGRGVPDVSGNADPLTGYQVLIDGTTQVIGGTSAVAPLWAALIARFAQALGKSFGLIQQQLYAGVQPGHPVAGLRDITSGDNGAYAAGAGWDACTGLGVPEGAALLAVLSASTPPSDATGA
jgi:kumamolisin